MLDYHDYFDDYFDDYDTTEEFVCASIVPFPYSVDRDAPKLRKQFSSSTNEAFDDGIENRPMNSRFCADDRDLDLSGPIKPCPANE